MDTVEEIKSRLAIDDVVGSYVDLKRSGQSYKGLCPFHQEKTPSFLVTPSRGTYHCFGCGKGGDIFSFVMEMDRTAFPEALTRLATRAGVSLPERQPPAPSFKNKLYEANEAAARFFADTLKSEAGTRARRYLEERRFGPKAIMAFDLGVAPDGREALTMRLRQSGFDDHTLLAAGLNLQTEAGEVRDRFRGRLMFPIRNGAGKITGFGGRALGDAQPKYLNSPQTEIFDKSGVLFGVHRSREAIRQAGKAVLVEGYLDAVRAHVAGHANVVASLGTAVTPQQLSALVRLTDTVVLTLDPDAAGRSAAARTSLDSYASVLRSGGKVLGGSGTLDLRICTLPREYGDPDELIRDHPELWEQAVERSAPALDFYMDQTLETIDRSAGNWRQTAIEKIVPVIKEFGGSADVQPRWVERLSRETGIELGALRQSMRGGGRGVTNGMPRGRDARPIAGAATEAVTAATSRALTTDPREHTEDHLIALLLKLVVVPDEAANLIQVWSFARPEQREIVGALVRWAGRENYDYQMFRNTLSDAAKERADTLLALDEPLPADGRISLAVAYYLARLHLFSVDVQMTRATEAMHDAASEDRTMAMVGLGRLMEERRQTEHELNYLSQVVLRSGGALDQGTMDHEAGSS